MAFNGFQRAWLEQVVHPKHFINISLKGGGGVFVYVPEKGVLHWIPCQGLRGPSQVCRGNIWPFAEMRAEGLGWPQMVQDKIVVRKITLATMEKMFIYRICKRTLPAVGQQYYLITVHMLTYHINSFIDNNVFYFAHFNERCTFSPWGKGWWDLDTQGPDNQ